MFNPTISLWLILSCPQLALSQPKAIDKDRVRPNLAAHFKLLHQQDDFNGVVLVSHEGSPLFHQAYGKADMELDAALSLDSPFLIASITKTFTAGAIMTLRDSGKLKWEDKVAKYLPDFPHGEAITIRDLLAHAGGLDGIHNYDKKNDPWRQKHSLPELLNIIGSMPLRFEPGSKHVYSNEGFIVLAAVIEAVSGVSYETYLGKHFFEPLKMKHTGLFNWERLIPGRTKGHLPGPPPHHWSKPEYYDLSNAIGSGALGSTAKDLAAFGRAVVQKRFFDLDKEAWPWGWGKDEREGIRWLSQTGMMPGFFCLLLAVPEPDIVMVVMSNAQTFQFSALQKDLPAIVFGFPYEKPKPRPAYQPKKQEVQEVVGTYAEGENRRVLFLRDGHLFQDFGGSSAQYLKPIGDGIWFDPADGGTLTAVRTDKGKVTGIHIKWSWGEMSFKKTKAP